MRIKNYQPVQYTQPVNYYAQIIKEFSKLAPTVILPGMDLITVKIENEDQSPRLEIETHDPVTKTTELLVLFGVEVTPEETGKKMSALSIIHMRIGPQKPYLVENVEYKSSGYLAKLYKMEKILMQKKALLSEHRNLTDQLDVYLTLIRKILLVLGERWV